MAWIEQLNLWLNAFLANERLLQWSFLGTLGVLIFVVSIIIVRLVQNHLNPVKGRIDTIADPSIVISSSQRAILDKEAKGQRLLERLGKNLTPKDKGKRNSTADKLAQIGYRRDVDLHIFNGFKILCSLGLPLVAGGILLAGGWFPLRNALPMIALAIPMGMIIPDYWLVKVLKSRQAALRRSLPDALDMLVVCSEAGLGLNAAIQRVAMEMDIQHPQLADELKTTMLQMSAGMDSRSALQELSNRTGIDEIRSLVSTLHQAMRYGTSISETLRSYSADMRNKRLEHAQERAASAGVKMLIPIAMCMLPAILFIVLGPPMLQVAQQLSAK